MEAGVAGSGLHEGPAGQAAGKQGKVLKSALAGHRAVYVLPGPYPCPAVPGVRALTLLRPSGAAKRTMPEAPPRAVSAPGQGGAEGAL